MRATIVDTGCSAITMVDQRVCGSVRGGVEMTEEDSTAVKGAGSALLGMGTSADWTKEDVGVHSNVLGDARDVVGMLRGILTLGTNHEVVVVYPDQIEEEYCWMYVGIGMLCV